MHARLTDDAVNDLEKLADYLHPRNPQALQRMLAAIFTTIGQLELFPFLGHEGRVEGTRELVVPRTPFIIVYSLIDPVFIDIDRILHGRMKYPPEDGA